MCGAVEFRLPCGREDPEVTPVTAREKPVNFVRLSRRKVLQGAGR